jgi:hypothetical protein
MEGKPEMPKPEMPKPEMPKPKSKSEPNRKPEVDLKPETKFFDTRKYQEYLEKDPEVIESWNQVSRFSLIGQGIPKGKGQYI